MNVVHSLTCMILALSFNNAPAWSQTAIINIQTQAEDALRNGDAERTVLLTQRAIDQDPEFSPAHFIQATAYLQLDQSQEAAVAAGRAYDTAENDTQRVQAARLASRARLETGQFSRAEFWLRRAANIARTPQETAAIQNDFSRVRQVNPLTVWLNFSVTPSNNINNGSEETTGEFEGFFEFELPATGRALSGVAYAGSAQLSYRLAQSSRYLTSLDGSLYGRTFTLSQEAQDIADETSQNSDDDISGSDFALTVLEVGITHKQRTFDTLGPTTVHIGLGGLWYGGEAFRSHRVIDLRQDFPIRENAAFSLSGSIEEQLALNFLQLDAVERQVTATYSLALSNNDIVQLSGSQRTYETDDLDSNFIDQNIVVSYRFSDPIWGMRLAVNGSTGRVLYDSFTTTLDGRQDIYSTIGTTAVFEGFSYFGFSPSVTFSAKHNESDISRFTKTTLQGQIGIQSNF